MLELHVPGYSTGSSSAWSRVHFCYAHFSVPRAAISCRPDTAELRLPVGYEIQQSAYRKHHSMHTFVRAPFVIYPHLPRDNDHVVGDTHASSVSLFPPLPPLAHSPVAVQKKSSPKTGSKATSVAGKSSRNQDQPGTVRVVAPPSSARMATAVFDGWVILASGSLCCLMPLLVVWVAVAVRVFLLSLYCCSSDEKSVTRCCCCCVCNPHDLTDHCCCCCCCCVYLSLRSGFNSPTRVQAAHNPASLHAALNLNNSELSRSATMLPQGCGRGRASDGNHRNTNHVYARLPYPAVGAEAPWIIYCLPFLDTEFPVGCGVVNVLCQCCVWQLSTTAAAALIYRRRGYFCEQGVEGATGRGSSLRFGEAVATGGIPREPYIHQITAMVSLSFAVRPPNLLSSFSLSL